ncbi:MAG: hypothetical protein BGO43_13970 [Gammaproteobacteria bacterium 39-13]|nr:hypothetical protein [Gammaproteobacteria bacterium]OJV85791.1 MAG: hypothetical protein BGO43_13970 [Gammaproteobacteria bacterium 39-13]
MLGGVKAEFDFELAFLGVVDLVKFREIYAMLYSMNRDEQERGMQLAEKLEDPETFLSYKNVADVTPGTIGYRALKLLATHQEYKKAEQELAKALKQQELLEQEHVRLKAEKQQILHEHARNVLTPSYQTKKGSAPCIKSTTHTGYHHYTPSNRKGDKDKCNVM